jgi:limonene 1,2-monooxygenase
MKTDWFELREARLQIPPFQRPRTEMAVACARSPSGALAAGRQGLGLLSIGGTSDEALVAHARNWKMCEAAAAEAGKTVHRRHWRLVTLMHIAETREKARRNVEYGLEAWARYFREVATFPIVPPGITDPYAYLIENKMAVIGTPDDAIAYIETLLGGAGGFGALLQLAHNWADWAETKRHYELMARYVFPHFQNSNRLREASYDYSHANWETFAGRGADAIQSEIDRYRASKKGEAGE